MYANSIVKIYQPDEPVLEVFAYEIVITDSETKIGLDVQDEKGKYYHPAGVLSILRGEGYRIKIMTRLLIDTV